VHTQGDQRRILVVDDEELNLRLLERCLRHDGYDVLTAPDADTALALVAGNDFDLLLLDVELGATDGITLCRQVRERHPDRMLPILFVTGHSDRDTRLRGLDAGGDDYLGKPVDFLELQIRVRNLLRSKANHDAQEEFQRMVENGLDITTVVQPDGTIRYESPSITRILGYAPDELVGKNIFQVIHPEDRARVQAVFDQEIARGMGSPLIEFRFLHADGSWRVLASVGHRLPGPSARRGVVVSSRDVTARKAMEARLEQSEARHSLAARASNDGLWEWEPDNGRVYFSERWLEMLGIGTRGVAATPHGSPSASIDTWFTRIHELDRDRVRAELAMHLAGTVPTFESEYRLLHVDGSYRWMWNRALAVRDPQAGLRIAGFQRDLTEVRAYDRVTGLPNRVMLADRLEVAIRRCQESAEFLAAVLFVDVVGFKALSQSMGRPAADELLGVVARRLEAISGGREHLVTRAGADHFILLASGLSSGEAAVELAKSLVEAVGPPCRVREHEIFASVRVGIAMVDRDSSDVDNVLKQAEVAANTAEREGSGWAVYAPHMLERATRRFRLESELRRTVEERRLTLHYQPILRLTDGHVTGFEALVRWPHPERGLIPPAEFIPVAESTGVIVTLGEWVLGQACAQLAAWRRSHPAANDLGMSVNVSARQLANGLVHRVERVLGESGIDPAWLTLELTESALMSDERRSREVLGELRRMKVGLSLDDFGTGYSSLAYLHRFPVDYLKVDRSFVSDLGRESGTPIVGAIVGLAHNLGIRVVAEGVETASQLDHLRRLGCESAQGYLFSRPVDAGAAGVLLGSSEAWLGASGVA
jgi:PAS domain S-box-containing protein/diguanylate cyclase (GGDEF)-like protein